MNHHCRGQPTRASRGLSSRRWQVRTWMGRGQKVGPTWERTGKPSGGEPRAPTALFPMREQEPAFGTLSTKLICAGFWNIHCEMRTDMLSSQHRVFFPKSGEEECFSASFREESR